MHRSLHAGRRLTLAVAGALAVSVAIAVLVISGARAPATPAAVGPAHDSSAALAAQTTRKLAFHDAMRKLWEQHVAWTRLAIVSFAGDLPDLPSTEQRLLRNQTDIGDAIKPFYGRAAGDRLTTLLKEHITGAVAVLVAAKAGDRAKLAQAEAAWYANGRQVSDFLGSANPRNWPRAEMRAMMKTHLDQTLAEGVDQLTGRYASGVREYGAIEQHIEMMADSLSDGIMRQFPGRFR